MKSHLDTVAQEHSELSKAVNEAAARVADFKKAQKTDFRKVQKFIMLRGYNTN